MDKAVSQKVLKNLNRVEGQVRGIAQMVEADRYCIDVVTQIEAARAALARIEIRKRLEAGRALLIGRIVTTAERALSNEISVGTKRQSWPLIGAAHRAAG